MIKVEKPTLLALMTSYVNQASDESYEKFTELFLMAIGAVDIDGNLTEEYKQSAFWKMEDEYLKPTLTELADQWQSLLGDGS